MTPEQAPHLIGCLVTDTVIDHVGRLLRVNDGTYTLCEMNDIEQTWHTKLADQRILLWRDMTNDPRGQIVDRSWSDGLSVAEAWCSLFEANAWLISNNQQALARTDDQVYNSMRCLFPERAKHTVHWRQVERLRQQYNRGAFSPQKEIAPIIPSRRVCSDA